MSAADALGHPWIVNAVQQSSMNERVVITAEGKLFASAMRKYANLYREKPLKHFGLQLMAWSTVSDERAAASNIFESIDKNKDGICSLEELETLLITDLKMSGEAVKQTCQAIRDTKFEEITYTDIVSSLIFSQTIPYNQRMLVYAFSNLYDDECGCITEDSLRASVGNQLGHHSIADVFAEIDHRRVGKISYKQFVTYLCGDE